MAREDAGESNKPDELNPLNCNGTSSYSNWNLVNKLRAINLEIEAAASSVEQLEKSKKDVPDGNDKTELERHVQISPNDLSLQHADNQQNDWLIRNPIREVPKPKHQPKRGDKTSQNKNKMLKKVSVDDDGSDANLNAASAGFVETKGMSWYGKKYLLLFTNLKVTNVVFKNKSSSKHENNELASSSIAGAVQLMSKASQAHPTTKMLDPESAPKLEAPTCPFQRLQKLLKIPQSCKIESERGKDIKTKNRRPQPENKWKRLASREERLQEEGTRDLKTSSNEGDGLKDVDDEEPSYVTLEGGLKIPETVFSTLFDYQKVGVQWLWELHFSGMYKPSIIICPVAHSQQWKREARKWDPSFCVKLLHESVQGGCSRKKRPRSSDSDSSGSDNDSDNPTDKSGLLITTYEQLRLQGDKLLDIEWGYAVLDEGHHIRSPNAEVTLVCKQLQTVHRIIMTGAPIQNKLSKLWSLFDFVFPGKLGVLPVFEAEFAVPISVGGYANTTPLQVSTAYRCFLCASFFSHVTELNS
ncbi:hypothetical protein OROMI_008551 [Orobanche minor]